MPEFPKLKTGAVTQYGSSTQRMFKTTVDRFVGGREQSYREFRAPVRKWIVKVDQLSVEELNTVQSFFDEMKGSYGTFTFHDPWDGTDHENCSFEGDDLAVEFASYDQGGTTLNIRENVT